MYWRGIIVLPLSIWESLVCFPEILGLVYGADFTGVHSSRVLVLVMFFSCIMLYKQGLARVLAAKNLMWWGYISNAVWSVVLLGSFLGLVRWGAVGLALAFTLAYALNTIVFVPLYTRRGLVPKETIISKEAAIVWLTIAGLCSVTLLGYSLAVRIVSLLFGVLFLFTAFRRLSRSAEKI